MKNLLVIQSSPRGKSSVSRQLTSELVEKIVQQGEVKVVERDLSVHPLPHLQEEQITGFYTPVEKRSEVLKEAVRLSDEAVAELFAADVIVISTPFWNFSVPSVLKAWIDHVARAGVTFSYGPDGVKGLVTGKKVIIVASSGGVYSSGPGQVMDFLGPYLKAVLGFLGITDVSFIRAEGVSDPKAQGKALDLAHENLEAALAKV